MQVLHTLFYVKVQIMHLILAYEVQKMNEKKYKNKYKKRNQFQQKMISRQSEQIERLKNENKKLTLECQKKDELINSVTPLRNELQQNVNEVKKQKKEFNKLIQEMKKMKSIMNRTVFRGRWRLIKWLIK